MSFRKPCQRAWRGALFALVPVIGFCQPHTVSAHVTIVRKGGQSTTPAWRPRVEARGSDVVSEVVVNGITVLRLRGWRGGLGPFQRAQITASRLEASLAALSPETVRVDTVSDPNAPRLMAGGDIIATVPVNPVTDGPKRTRARRTATIRASAQSEVHTWATALRKALAIPGLAVEASGRMVPMGEMRSLKLRGAARGPVQVALAGGEGNGRVVGVSVDEVQNVITIQGLRPGREVLTLEREGAVETLYIVVKPYAGGFSPDVSLTVTGSVAPANLIIHHALATALNAAHPIPGAQARISGSPVGVIALKPGGTRTVVVPVRIEGPDMLPVERHIHVTVSNRNLLPVHATTLFYSNNPERLEKPGTLFVGRMTATTGATRLLYHHQSATDRPLRFLAELVNDGDSPARIQVVGGDAGPERDTVWVGYRAAADFVTATQAEIGAVVEVPAHSRIALSSLRLPAGLTISGLMQLRLISGPAPLVRIAVEEMPTPGTLTRMALLPVPLANGGDQSIVAEMKDPKSLSEHVYAEPQQRVAASYTVGGKWTFVPLGRDPLKAKIAVDTKLYGNYGVFYDIDVKLQNPTDQESKARVVFEPSAGLAGGVFVIGDRTVEIPRSNMPDETTLATYILAPGETRDVSIRTLPLSGSNYPATIIVRP